MPTSLVLWLPPKRCPATNCGFVPIFPVWPNHFPALSVCVTKESTSANSYWANKLLAVAFSRKQKFLVGKAFANKPDAESEATFPDRGVTVKVKFTLNMENLEVDDKHIDRLCISWINETSEEEVLSMSGQWINSKNLLTQRMVGLNKVGESSLTIEPL
jgi:hypothetical protein